MPKHKNLVMDELLLYQVVTVPEACELWGLPRNTIMYALDIAIGRTGDLVYRKSGSTWLITVASMVRRYGQPRTKQLLSRRHTRNSV